MLWIEIHNIEVISMVCKGYLSVAYIVSVQMKSAASFFQSKNLQEKDFSHERTFDGQLFLLPTPNSTRKNVPSAVSSSSGTNLPKMIMFVQEEAHETYLE